MKFNTTGKMLPELLAANPKDGRPVLSYAYLRIEETEGGRQGFLETTDSFRLARIPVALHAKDVEGFIPIEALKAKTKHTTRFVEPELICMKTKIRLVDAPSTQEWKRENAGTWPNIPLLIPPEDELSKFEVWFNPKFLAEIARALGSPERIRIRFTKTQTRPAGPSNMRPMLLIDPDHSEKGIALLMPIRPVNPR